MRNIFSVAMLLVTVACGSKDETGSDEGDVSDVDADGATDDGADGDGDADADGAGEDTATDDTGEEPPVLFFDVNGVYEGTFSIGLAVALIPDADPLEDTCTGEVVFHVEESGDPSISGTGACSFSEDGALSSFVESGLVDSLGPFEGLTSGEVLTRPDAVGSIAIETSIGEISTEWTGVFAEASGDAAATLNGSLDGSIGVDLGEVIDGFGEVDVVYLGTFESVRTGDLPEEDTGDSMDTGMDDASGGTETGGSETGDTAGDGSGGEVGIGTETGATSTGGSETGETAGDDPTAGGTSTGGSETGETAGDGGSGEPVSTGGEAS